MKKLDVPSKINTIQQGSSNQDFESKSSPGFLMSQACKPTLGASDCPDCIYTRLPGKGRAENQKSSDLENLALRTRAVQHVYYVPQRYRMCSATVEEHRTAL